MSKFKSGDIIHVERLIKSTEKGILSGDSWQFEPCEEYEVYSANSYYHEACYQLRVVKPHPNSKDDLGKHFYVKYDFVDKNFVHVKEPSVPSKKKSKYFPNLSNV